jgi:hypothetical protein
MTKPLDASRRERCGRGGARQRRAQYALSMRAITSAMVLLLTAAVPALAQSNWFQPAVLERPDVKKALQSVDQRSSAVVDEWIRLVEIPAPSRK